MIKNIARCALVSVGMLMGSTGAHAEDIDIFLKSTTSSVSTPNVLIILDNTSNWSSQFSYEMTALRNTVVGLANLPDINIGIMEQTGGGTDGGYMRFATRSVGGTGTAATTNRTALIGIIDEITARGGNSSIEKANNPTYAQTYNEAYLYLKGGTPRAGLGDNKRDCGLANAANNAYASPLGNYAYTSCATTATYVSPISSAAVCQKTFIIYISNGPIANNDNGPGLTLLQGVGGDTTVISVTPNGETASSYADEWSRFIKKDLGVVSYTVNVNPGTNSSGLDHTAMMDSIAKISGGSSCSAASSAQLVSCIGNIFDEIFAVNGVFASTTLPLSADNSGAYLNQLYVGMFQPDIGAKPRWYGNLKQYKFAYSATTNSLTVVDSANTLATSSATGFVQPNAVSFWTSKTTSSAPDAAASTSTSATTGSTGGFWAFDPTGTGLSYDSPDGEWVQKGGAAQQLRLAYLGYGGKGGIGDTNASTLNSQEARKVYTCTGTCLTTSGSLLSATPFDSTNAAITDVSLGLASGTSTSTLIKWIRGQDTGNENNFKVNATDTDVRPSIHGDVLHSRPVVLNYANSGSDNVYLFYGGNDGVFRAVKGGQAATDGKEQWAFIPQDFFGKFLRLYNDSPTIAYTGTTSGTATKKDYAFDGPVGSYIERNSSGTVTKAYLYIGVRRGGRFIYALDVTSPTAPKFLWKISNTTSGFSELAQSWSQPNVVKIRANTNPVLIFGAGYDAVSEDVDSPIATTNTMGRGIYVVDAFTGALVWSAGNSASSPNLSVTGMNFSIAGDVLPIDRTFDGYVDRVYAADVGGNVWRFDINDTVKTNWAAWKLASLGDRSTVASSRKFLFGMDVVLGDTFDAILLGSGDREHPLSTSTANSVTNRFYMIKDTNVGLTGSALGITDTSAGVSTGFFNATSSSTVPATATGYYFTLATGEKVTNAPLAAGGHVLFGTNQPDTSSASCTGNLGIARRYNVNYLEGTPASFTTSTGTSTRSEVATGGGFLPSPVTGIVEIPNTNGVGVQNIVFATDNPLNPGGSEIVNITVPTKRYRTYWYEKIE